MLQRQTCLRTDSWDTPEPRPTTDALSPRCLASNYLGVLTKEIPQTTLLAALWRSYSATTKLRATRTWSSTTVLMSTPAASWTSLNTKAYSATGSGWKCRSADSPEAAAFDVKFSYKYYFVQLYPRHGAVTGFFADSDLVSSANYFEIVLRTIVLLIDYLGDFVNGIKRINGIYNQTWQN